MPITDGVIGVCQFMGSPSLAGERCRLLGARLPPAVWLYRMLGAADVARCPPALLTLSTPCPLAGIQLVSKSGAKATMTGKLHGPLLPNDGGAAITLEQFAGRNTTKAGQSTAHNVTVEGSDVTLHELLQLMNHEAVRSASECTQLGAGGRWCAAATQPRASAGQAALCA
jgi:hypothetical protein